VADIPLSVQVKLLRTLEHGEVLPVGGDRPVQSDFRIISATHQDLCQRVAKQAFRHDLYFRLITFEIELPPLRDRQGDVAELTRYFLDVLAAKNGLPRASISAEGLAELERRTWYGNVRELRNALEHAMILAPGGQIGLEYLPPPTPPSFAADAGGEESLAALLRQWTETQLRSPEEAADLYDRLLKLVEPPVLRAVVQHFHGQCAAAARRLGLHRTTLRKKLDEMGVPDDQR
jgi:two-component system nitrogen regulation response regulator GlnG